MAQRYEYGQPLPGAPPGHRRPEGPKHTELHEEESNWCDNRSIIVCCVLMTCLISGLVLLAGALVYFLEENKEPRAGDVVIEDSVLPENTLSPTESPISFAVMPTLMFTASPSVTKTQSPTSSRSLECQAQRSLYLACLDTLPRLERTGCLHCIVNLIETSERSCRGFAAGFCEDSEGCGCGSCLSLFDDFFDCFFDCGTLCPPRDSPASPPQEQEMSRGTDDEETDAICPQEEATYRQCLNNMPTLSANMCIDCVNDGLNVVSDITVCSQYNEQFCPELQACAICSNCLKDIDVFIDCEFGGPSCTVDCIAD